MFLVVDSDFFRLLYDNVTLSAVTVLLPFFSHAQTMFELSLPYHLNK